MTPDKYSLLKIETLHPKKRTKVKEIWLSVASNGIPFCEQIRITCGFRGRSEQEKAFADGKSKARFGYSFHNYGLAFDSCILLPGGQVDFDVDKYPFYKEFIDLMKLEGFSYSGDWTGDFQEKGHTEYNVIPISRLKTLPLDSKGYVII